MLVEKKKVTDADRLDAAKSYPSRPRHDSKASVAERMEWM